MFSAKFNVSRNFYKTLQINKRFASIEKIFTNKQVEFFRENGYAVLPNVFSQSWIDELKQEIDSIINKANVNEINSFFDPEHLKSDKYFIESGDKIRFFLEKDSFDENKKLKLSFKESLNKIGHAVHDLNPKFQEFSYSKEIKFILRNLEFISPIIVQSMYIFKNERIGGEVPPHTDNTYIRSKPLSCVGIWIAFDDATIENGCMWGVPGSHKNQTNYFLKATKDEKGNSIVKYEPNTPPQYDIVNPVALEAQKGSVILLHGDFVHFSYNNSSSSHRHAYTLHAVESRNHVWESDNWLQRKETPFRFVNDTL